MTAKDYIKQHSRHVNGMLVVGPIKEDSHYCIQCFDKDGELVKVTHSPDPYGWTCPKGHFGQGQKLATGGWA